MRTVGARLMAGLVAALLVLSGCGGSPEPKPVADPPKSASPSPSASASPTPPVMPAAAKRKTKAGAAAFVRSYVENLNYAGSSGDTSSLRKLSLSTCVKCEALVNGIDKIYAHGGHISGGGWTLVRIRQYGFKQSHYFLDATIDSAPQEMTGKAGADVQKFPGARNRLRAFVLDRAANGWRVSELDPTA